MVLIYIMNNYGNAILSYTKNGNLNIDQLLYFLSDVDIHLYNHVEMVI